MLRRFVGKSVSTFVIKIIGIGISFIAQIFLARIMGASDFGYYVYIMTLINIILLFSKIGFDTVIVRFIPEYISKKDWVLFNGIRRKSFIVTTQLSICISIIIWVSYSIIKYYYKEPEWGEAFLLGLFLLPIVTANVIIGSILQSLKKVVASSFLSVIIRPLLLLIFLFIYYTIISNTITPKEVILFNIESSLVVFLIGSIFLRKSIFKLTKEKKYKYVTKEWMLVSYSMFLISAINLIQNYTDIVMIEYFIDAKSVGIYSITNQISGFIGFGLVSANMVLAPMISSLYHSKKYNQLQKLITFSTRLVFIFTSLSSIFVILLGDRILGLFGVNFVDGLEAMKILVIGQLVNAFTGSVGFIMTMTGHQQQAGRILILSVVVNVLLNLVLIPLYGIEGAAVATAVSMSVWNIIMFIYVLRKIGFSSSVFNFSKEFSNEN